MTHLVLVVLLLVLLLGISAQEGVGGARTDGRIRTE